MDSYPEYEIAYSEITSGRKKSCWMWYVWPTLRGVREHRMPDMVLESFGRCCEYLAHPVLGPRLADITQAAVRQLQNGIQDNHLFQSNLDSTKFCEACSVFAIAAAFLLLNGYWNDEEVTISPQVFVDGLHYYGNVLNEDVVDVLLNDYQVDDRYFAHVNEMLLKR